MLHNMPDLSLCQVKLDAELAGEQKQKDEAEIEIRHALVRRDSS
jgi:hypothetical protein